MAQLLHFQIGFLKLSQVIFYSLQSYLCGENKAIHIISIKTTILALGNL